MRALIINIELDVREIHHMEIDGARVSGHQVCQVHHLLLCPFAGIRRGMEIHCVYLHASLGNHVACHRTVDAAGQQQHGPAVGSHRHASGSGYHQ